MPPVITRITVQAFYDDGSIREWTRDDIRQGLVVPGSIYLSPLDAQKAEAHFQSPLPPPRANKKLRPMSAVTVAQVAPNAATTTTDDDFIVHDENCEWW